MIEVDPSRCSGCRSCEVACSFFHSGSVGRRISRIHVINVYETGVDAPVTCVQCAERYCQKCPEQALSIGALGQVVFSPTLCKRCGKCARRCPIGAIQLTGETVYVCDLCGGSPKCVEACDLGALRSVPAPQGQVSLQQRRERTKGLNASERRRAYVEHRTAELRRRWGATDG
jgi:Fe-S-cluster-containing hydrogenase component 2